MTIRTKILINVLLLTGSFLIIALVLNVGRVDVSNSVEEGFLADRITIGVSDMNTITYDYMMNPSERAIQQWELKHASLANLLKGTKFEREEQRDILRRIVKNHEEASPLFEQLIRNSAEKRQISHAKQARLDEDNERIVAQLMARTQVMISDVNTLSQASGAAIRKVQFWSFGLIAAVLVITAVLASAISYFLSRNITTSMETLKRGAEIIAKGDLDHRVPVKSKDEIGALSESFNEMTVRLKDANASIREEMRKKEKAQEDLQKAHNELESRVVERTKELSQSEQRVSRILSSITDCYYFLDRNWRATEINDRALQYFGMKRGDFLNSSYREIFPAALGSIIEEQYKRAVSEQTPVTFDLHSPANDQWAEIHAYPSEEGISVYFKDITARKQAEAEAQRLATFPRLNPNPIIEVGLDGYVHFLNPAAERLFPDIHERGLNHPWLAQWESIVRTCRETGLECSAREVTVDGSWYQQTIHFVREYQRIRIYGLDITERMAADMEIRERTVQLEAANKELDDFTYTVAHDLRSPLRAINGFSSRLLRDFGDKLNEDGVKKIHTISRNTRHMGQLIDDLLSFSRLGRKEMHMSEVNMETIANGVWKEIKELNPDRELDFRIVNMIPSFGDPSLIRQVFANLLSNAVKFTKNCKPAVIEAGCYTEMGENIYYVKDNGIGFDMKYYDKLFGVFERLHRPEEYEGTGVGLAIVMRVIQRHSGRLWAEGKLNAGAIFYFTLPGKDNNFA